MSGILSAISCNLDNNLLLASLPLFKSEKVQAIEWSFDALHNNTGLTPWFSDLLKEFGNNNRLIGHGVFFSLFSGKWSADQKAWLVELARLSTEFRFDHVTEHFGFMTGQNFHTGAPIGIPMNTSTLALGVDRLKRIQQACNCPVGLENLAFSYSLEEVKKHGDFLNRLIEPVNGFIILDLHNLFCQIHNFEMSFDDLIKLYPLDKVREIHISGGSWVLTQANPEKKIRRDTHDERVPEEIFKFVEKAIDLCPNLKYIVLEQIGTGLDTPESRCLFQEDFYKLESTIHSKSKFFTSTQSESFLPTSPILVDSHPIEDTSLYTQQQQLSNILESAVSYKDAQRLFKASALNNSQWDVKNWDPSMIETAIAIAQKWKQGFI